LEEALEISESLQLPMSGEVRARLEASPFATVEPASDGRY
jgi:hypothetical protein